MTPKEAQQASLLWIARRGNTMGSGLLAVLLVITTQKASQKLPCQTTAPSTATAGMRALTT